MGPSKDPKKVQGDFRPEDVLQAVLVAEGFPSRFGPLSLDTPPALLPLHGTPLIDYAFEFLVDAGVDEIFVVSTGAHPSLKDRIEAHPRTISGGCRVTHVASDALLSVGDALREMDKTGALKNDFVLMTADVVANCDLTKVVAAHKQRRAKDKQMAMTVVLREGLQGPSMGCPSWSPADEAILACDANSDKILHFQKLKGEKNVEIPVHVFQDCESVSLRYDILDPGIAICSPLVPQIFSDDFDYQTRDDFIRGLLVHQEIMGNSLYASVVKMGFAARVFDLSTFNSVSHQVLARWAFPLCPDLFPANTENSPKVCFQRGAIYRASNVAVGRGSRLETNVFVGAGTRIGDGVLMKNCSVGPGCEIGNDCQLEGVHLFAGVTLGKNCRITHSILSSQSSVGDGATLLPGCVLGSGVKVGSGVVLPERTELTLDEAYREDDAEEKLGSDGHGYAFQPDDDDEEEDDDDEVAPRNWWEPFVEDEDESEDGTEEDVSDQEGEDDEADDEDDEEMKDLKLFQQEVLDTLRRGFEENVSSENLVLEINSLKQAYFIYIAEVQQCVVKSVLKDPVVSMGLRGKPLLLHIRKHGLALLKNYVKDSDSQRLAMIALADVCAGADDLAAAVREVLTILLGLLYNEDVLSDSDAFFLWFEDQEESTSKLFAPFAAKLKAAEEEDDDDDDDD